MATLEERVTRLESKQRRLTRVVRGIAKALYIASTNGLLPVTCRALFKQEHDKAEQEAE